MKTSPALQEGGERANVDKVKLGFVPTRRSIFSAPDAIKYRGLTVERLREIGVEVVDIDDVNDEGLLFDDSHVQPIIDKFRVEGVDGIMLAHCNFGTEYLCARLARELGKPVLLWGPRDERPSLTGRACATPSAACSPRARSCAVSRSRSPI